MVVEDEFFQLLSIDKDGRKILHFEDSKVEFKESFSKANKFMYAKIMAAFANNKGGYIIFGINNHNEIIGVNERFHSDFDTSELTQLISDFFEPEIVWEKSIRRINEKSIGVIQVFEAKNKPIICKSTRQSILKGGDIYYRYPGQTKRISYSELRTIIEAEKRKLLTLFIAQIKEIFNIGVENAKIINASIIQHINTDSSMGVKFDDSVETETKTIVRVPTRVGSFEVVDAFLKERLESGITSLEYIRAIANSTSANFPIYFFMQKEDISAQDVINFLKMSVPSSPVRDRLIKKLELGCKPIKPFPLNAKTFASRRRKEYYDAVLSEEIRIEDFETKEPREIKYFLEALTNLTRPDLAKVKQKVFPILLQIFLEHYREEVRLSFRQLLCYFDTILFFDPINYKIT